MKDVSTIVAVSLLAALALAALALFVSAFVALGLRLVSGAGA